MLLILLLVGFLSIVTIFAIALVWDYTHGIFSFSKNADAAMLNSAANEPECTGSPQPMEYPTA